MTKIDNSKASEYVRDLLDLEAIQCQLTIGRMHNRTVDERWGTSEPIKIRAHHLTLLTAGQANFQINGERFTLRRGTLLFTSPQCRQTYGYAPDAPPTVLTVRFDPKRNDSILTLPHAPSKGCFLALTPGKETAFLELMEHLFRCWIRRADPIAYRAAHWTLQSLLWSLYDESVQTEPDSPDRLMEDVRLMLESDPESNVSIRELANRAGLSPAHFSRRFRNYAGTTAKSYQFEVRMRHARHLLQTQRLSVKQVADRMGYSDPFVFSRQFKKIWGVPPSKV